MGANWPIKEWRNLEPGISYWNIHYADACNFGNTPGQKVACIAECNDLWGGRLQAIDAPGTFLSLIPSGRSQTQEFQQIPSEVVRHRRQQI